MRVLLVRPHIPLKVARRLEGFLHLEPLALEIVAGGIPSGHSVRILDLAGVPAAERVFRRELTRFRPDVVGFTCYSNQAANVKRLAGLVKAAVPQALTVVGGTHATIVPTDFRLPGVIDLVVRGEGGSVMPRLFEALERGGPLPEDQVFLPTAGAGFDTAAANPPPPLPDYEAIPQARRDLVERSRYFCIWYGGKGERLKTLYPQTATLRTSVGCPNRCTFCVVHYLANGKYVQRAPAAVVDEIAQVPQEHIYFVDDEMFINASRAEAIARLLIERGIRKHYVSWARADTICAHPELFRLWKEAGLTLVYVGLESMNAATLEAYNKRVAPDVNRQAVTVLRELGIGLHAAFMVNPEFTEEDFRALRQTIGEVTPAEVTFTVFSPPPGTPAWQQYRERFICADPYAFYDCMHTLLPTALPLRKFYSQFALLYLMAFRKNPWRENGVKVPFRDLCRFMYRGALYGWALRTIHRDYRQ